MAMLVKYHVEERQYSSHFSSLGFALFFLVAFAVFLVVWEKRLGQACDQLYDIVSRSVGNNQLWFRIERLTEKFSW